MACSCNLSSSFLSSIPLHNFGKFKAVPSVSRISRKRIIICEAKEEESKSRENKFNFLKLSVTLTVISASLPQPSLAAKVSEKKRSRKKSEAITAEELKKWGKDLPVISHRLAYSEILDLKRENKLKHVIKTPIGGLKLRPQVVLAVLEDNEVVRIVLPSIDSDPKFWKQWDELKIDGICVNAYTPPLKKPEIPAPFLLDLLDTAVMKLPSVKSELELEPESESTWRPKPQSKKALELKRMRKELKMAKERELESSRKQKEMMEKTKKMQKKKEERQKREEMRKMRYEEALWEARENLWERGEMWTKLANDQNVATVMGWCFFYLFYHTVVFSYRKQRKDYEDRLKIEKAEAEEKKKMRELEKEMEGIEDDNDDEEGGTSGENAYMKVAQKFMRSGARVRRPKHRRPPQYLETGVDVKFSDVAGLGKIRLELEEVVKFFTHREIYSRRGVKIPGGILLCGPPGVGKTLLAKAVAGEAGVNFFSISASQFVEIYVGVGASRVRALYQEAKDNAPSIVFIDELDAVGRERGHTSGSGGQERDATLNQLLVCLDGFEGRGNVITIASTNRPDILDPALVRPGRFDRKIHIPVPGLQGRIEILKVHARKKPMAPDVDYATVADMTEGMVGAELANIIEVAAINMMRDGRTEIRTDDLLQAAQIEEQGMLENRERSNETVKQIAINEAAMAVVAVNFPDLNNIEYITIDPRGGSELGYVRMKMDQMKFKEGMFSRQSFLDYITIQLAPRAADELWHGEGQLSTIWADTADNARSAARSFVLGGLSERHYGVNNFWTTDRINDIDTEALRVLNMCYERAKEILRQNWKLLEAVVTNLVEKKNLTKIEFFNLVDLHGSLQSPPPSIVDIRSAQRSQLQNMIADKKVAVLQGRS